MNWQPMSTAPTDGEPFLAGLWVYQSHSPEALPYFEAHVIAADDEIEGTIHHDYEHGWQWGDYTHWMPLPAPPALATDDGRTG